MAKKLSDRDIGTVVRIIDGWMGKLTYEMLIDATEKPLGHRFTRQAFFSHTRIREAIALRKKTLKNEPTQKVYKSIELQVAIERIESLKAENGRLEAENEALLTQFVRWAYNAHSKGLSPDFLNKPLPRVDRRATIPRKNGKL